MYVYGGKKATTPLRLMRKSSAVLRVTAVKLADGRGAVASTKIRVAINQRVHCLGGKWKVDGAGRKARKRRRTCVEERVFRRFRRPVRRRWPDDRQNQQFFHVVSRVVYATKGCARVAPGASLNLNRKIRIGERS